jgi:myo-inositol 2-dehydrogenase/D-chiro-inositol 1-dehydrogenase
MAASDQAQRLRVGVVGCGGIARSHLTNLSASPYGEPYAYMDVNLPAAESYKERFGGEYATSDFEQILDDPKIDVILISSPDNLHSEQAMQALATGKHLFLEKPLATNIADALRVQEAVRAAKGKFMLDLKFRFAPALGAARDFVTQPMMIFGQAVGDPIPAGHWRKNPKMANGIIYDLGPHLYDLMYWFARAEPVRIFTEGIPDAESGLIDNAITTFHFANGARAVAMFGTAGQSAFTSKWLIELFGGDRNATVHAHAQEAVLRVVGGEVTRPTLPEGRSTGGDLGIALNAFLRAIVEDTDPPVSIEDGVRVTRMIDAALRSVESGQVVELEPTTTAA